MLPALVRLTDYMITESLVALVLNNLADLLALLASPNKIKGVFLTTVSFAQDRTIFTPDEAEVLKTVNLTVVEGILTSMASMPRLIFLRAFAPLFEAGAGPPGSINAGATGLKIEGLSPMAVLTADPEYHRIRDAITEAVTTSCAQVHCKPCNMRPNRGIFELLITSPQLLTLIPQCQPANPKS
jgi:hypothetical protein